MKQQLNLTDDQAAQVRAVHEELATRGKELGRTLRQARADLRQLALSGADEATVRAKGDEVTQLLGQLVALRVEGLRRIAPILNDEQREKLSQMGERAHHRGHRRGGHPRQPS
jgi:Spy/CpxP family protein refolding chaperone